MKTDLNREQVQLRLEEIILEIDTLTVSRRRLKERQEELRRNRDALRAYLDNPPNGKVRNAHSDLYCVSAALLIDVIDNYIERTGDTQMGLCARADIDPTSLRRMRRGETKFVTTLIADELLTAMGQQDRLGTDIPIVPNPYKTHSTPTGY